jgi:hypothetical protein
MKIHLLKFCPSAFQGTLKQKINHPCGAWLTSKMLKVSKIYVAKAQFLTHLQQGVNFLFVKI